MTTRGHFDAQDPQSTFTLTDPNTPRKWQHYLFNERMIAQLDQFGRGMGRYWDERGMDVLLFESPERSVAVRDGDGSVWSPAVYPGGIMPLEYGCEYNPAYWRVRGARNGCRVSWRIFVPVEASVEMWTVTVANEMSQPIVRDLFVYMPVNLMGYCLSKYRFYSATTMFIQAFKQPQVHAIWVKNGMPELPHDRFNIFLACDAAPTSTDTARDAFMGHADGVANADAVRRGRCSDSDAYFGETCLAMHHRVSLRGGETRTLNYLVGPTSGPDETERLCRGLLSPGGFQREMDALQAVRARERARCAIVSGMPSLDSLANTWVKRQNRLGVLHRKGFRDVLQDSAGMTVYDPARAREGLEEVLSVQRPDGAGIRAWKPYIDDMEYSDGPYWMPLAVGTYLRETGDVPFLDKPLPYFKSETRETVWDHLVKGVTYLYNDRNERGLCRIRFADWNDALDGVGREGKGDSTMVTFGLAAAIRELQAIARFAGRALPFDAEAWLRALSEAVEKHAWSGRYYIRGYRDDGQPYGSPQNTYGRIYLNAQAWAVISEIAPRDRWAGVLDEAIGQLATPYGLRLFVPSYPAFDKYLGRVSAELPGVYENGAMYNHGAAFFLQALLVAGRVRDAWRFLEMMLPDSRANPSDRSGAEPFVLTNCIFGEEAGRRAGTSYFGWYTGTAAWVVRLIHNAFTGLVPEFDGLHASPDLIPPEIGLRSYRREFRGTIYDVAYDAQQRDPVMVDGAAWDPRPLPARIGGTVRVGMRG